MDRAGLAPFGDDEIDRLGAGELDVRARCVEVRVVGNDFAGRRDDGEKDALGCAPLMGWDDVPEGEELAHRLEEAEPGRRPGVALVAVLDRGPLVSGHGSGAGIGEQIDEHVLRPQREQVVPGLAYLPAPLVGGGHPQWLDGVDAERLDDRAEALRHRRIIWTASSSPPAGRVPWSSARPPRRRPSTALRDRAGPSRPRRARDVKAIRAPVSRPP